MEYQIINDDSVRFHERIVSRYLSFIVSKPNTNFSHYRGEVEILEKVVSAGKVYKVVELGTRDKFKGGFYQALEVTMVSVPGTVSILYNRAFYNCVNLVSVILYEGLKVIESDCFWGCRKLERITIPDSVSTIEKCAFGQCLNLAEVTLGKSINNLDNTFSTCKLLRKVTCRAITPPDIFTNAFEKESYDLGELLVPYQSLELYKNHSAWGKFSKISYYDTPPTTETPPTPETPKIENFIVDGIRYWVKDANAKIVYVTNMKPGNYRGNISIPANVSYNGVNYQVKKIGNYSFNGCSDLKSVSLPNSIVMLHELSFANCINLTSLICLAATPPEVKSKAFDGVQFANVTLIVPKNSVNLYKTAEGWKNFVNILPLD